MNILKNKQGQTTLEYILMLSIIVSLFVGISKFMNDSQIASKILKPITEDYRRAYQFGATNIRGLEQEEVENHPRVLGGNNFKIFINPK
jgi:hypothetical protein